MVGRAADGSRQQMSDAFLREPAFFGKRIAYRKPSASRYSYISGAAKGGIAPEIAVVPSDPCSERQPASTRLPSHRRCADDAGTQGAPLQITELVEHEKRVIAGTPEVTVVGGALLFAMGRADA